MRKFMKTALIVLLSMSATCLYAAADKPDGMDNKIQALLDKHYSTYKDQEYFSGAALSFFVPGQPIKNYYVGRESHQTNSKKVSATTLFQIGSITKSFAAAIVLQLEKEKKLNLDDPLQKWLPSYRKWSQVTIESLLNMSSGLPNYSDTPLWAAAEYKTPTRLWNNKELIDFVYPQGVFSPPLKEGYFYSNTGYLLTAMLVEKITHHSFKRELEKRLFKPAQLTNTFYPIPKLPTPVKARMAQSYNYNQYDNPVLVGKNVQNVNMSWAGAAGAIVSTPEDVIKWVKALFVDEKIIDTSQKNKLTQLVSTATGKPITKTTQAEPRGFGLGVIEAYTENMGRYWFYQGETLGFRALYMYVPCNGIIVASIFNSATNGENDHAGELMKNIYAALMKQFPDKQCKS